MKDFSELRGLRVANGLTQEEMAEILGITSTSYHFKETGKREFKVSEANKIINLLDVDYEDIFLKSS